jgi:hypothetical protein
MCGSHLERADSSCPPILSVEDFNLCPSCQSEFDDYLRFSQGGERAHAFWHNNEWRELWSAWLNYQKAIRNFRRSPEFEDLVEEV